MIFQTPFRSENGLLVDATGKTVRLFGVNYYAPFNHNFYNIAELGKDYFQAVDQDFRHFRELGVRFIRIHLYDREITAPDGTIVENVNLDVFDYVLEKAEENGIYVMLTPIVWWNTVSTAIAMDEDYAYWYTNSRPAFGFSNYFSKDSLIWHPDAMACQVRYFKTLFAHHGKRTGKRICDYRTIVAIEPCNEPAYVFPEVLEGNLPDQMWAKVFSRGRLLKELRKKFSEFKAAHPEITSENELYDAFNTANRQKYIKTLCSVIDEFFGEQVVKTFFASYDGSVSTTMNKIFKENDIKATSFGTYLNASGFDSVNTDEINHLPMAEKWLKHVQKSYHSDLPKIVYEFDATGTQNGYPIAAIGAAYRVFNVQLAAYFTYTPHSVAAWNPGWLVHYLNMEYTPSKAAGFATAAAIFHSEESPEIVFSEECWRGKNFTIERKNDSVCYAGKELFCYSNDTTQVAPDKNALQKIIGRGSSPIAACSANGCYVLERQGEKEWILHLHPAQRFLSDPQRGRQYRHMANRWISCLKEPPVSQLLENRLIFEFHMGEIAEIRSLMNGKVFSLKTPESAELLPGDYKIILR